MPSTLKPLHPQMHHTFRYHTITATNAPYIQVSHYHCKFHTVRDELLVTNDFLLQETESLLKLRTSQIQTVWTNSRLNTNKNRMRRFLFTKPYTQMSPWNGMSSVTILGDIKLWQWIFEQSLYLNYIALLQNCKKLKPTCNWYHRLLIVAILLLSLYWNPVAATNEFALSFPNLHTK